VQARRCAAEMQLLGDGDEVAQEAQIGDAYKVSIDSKQVLFSKTPGA
jgi:hypothetical protein